VRALQLAEVGEPEDVLAIVDVPEPATAPDEVLIEVAACGLNFPDLLRVRGEYQVKPPLPFIPGAEMSGTVVEVGAEVTGFDVGNRVAAIQMIGGLAERCAVPAVRVHKIPDAMDFRTAAALYVTFRTAHLALFRRADLQPGESLLVHAGAGGVGSAAIQLGKAAGARVLATAGGADKTAFCREIGAELVVDYLDGDFVEPVKEATAGRGADVIFDPVGGPVFDRSRRCIAPEGRILVIGFTSGTFADAPTNHVLVKNYSVIGVNLGTYSLERPELLAQVHDDLDHLVAEHEIAPVVRELVALNDVPAALARMGQRRTIGKVVCELAIPG
jgi:NADPH2:quinone reductase